MRTEGKYQPLMVRLSAITVGMLLFLAACRNDSKQANNAPAKTTFGDSIPISNGLMGRVFLLPDTTRSLPDFDTLKPLPDPIYVSEINVPGQKWSVGFPGLRDRFEWFGVQYTGSFKPLRSATYLFKLISDDGSRLFIDDKLVINNDGIHAEWPVRASLHLSDSIHTFRLDYFQGPKYELALQLYWSVPDSTEKIFPGKDFVLYTPKPASYWWLWLLLALSALIILIILVAKRRKKTSSVSVPDSRTGEVQVNNPSPSQNNQS
jgi:hypothetical protein